MHTCTYTHINQLNKQTKSKQNKAKADDPGWQYE